MERIQEAKNQALLGGGTKLIQLFCSYAFWAHAAAGAKRIARQHERGKLTARERLELLLDKVRSPSRRLRWARRAAQRCLALDDELG